MPFAHAMRTLISILVIFMSVSKYVFKDDLIADSEKFQLTDLALRGDLR